MITNKFKQGMKASFLCELKFRFGMVSLQRAVYFLCKIRKTWINGFTLLLREYLTNFAGINKRIE